MSDTWVWAVVILLPPFNLALLKGILDLNARLEKLEKRGKSM